MEKRSFIIKKGKATLFLRGSLFMYKNGEPAIGEVTREVEIPLIKESDFPSKEAYDRRVSEYEKEVTKAGRELSKALVRMYRNECDQYNDKGRGNGHGI